jgi:hypothetical protein
VAETLQGWNWTLGDTGMASSNDHRQCHQQEAQEKATVGVTGALGTISGNEPGQIVGMLHTPPKFSGLLSLRDRNFREDKCPLNLGFLGVPSTPQRHSLIPFPLSQVFPTVMGSTATLP